MISRDWLCPSCGMKGTVEGSGWFHGLDLLLKLRNTHREASPKCPVVDPAITVPPGASWRCFLSYLEDDVEWLEKQVKSLGQTEPVHLWNLKNSMLFLDCQLTQDGESVEIGKKLDLLYDRISAAENTAYEFKTRSVSANSV